MRVLVDRFGRAAARWGVDVWTGIAMFAALAAGAPIGMVLSQTYGLPVAMVACIVCACGGGGIALGATAYASPAGRRLPFYRVLGQIWREGLGLMLQGVACPV